MIEIGKQKEMGGQTGFEINAAGQHSRNSHQ